MDHATRPLGRTGMEITLVGAGSWAIGGGNWKYGWATKATMRPWPRFAGRSIWE